MVWDNFEVSLDLEISSEALKPCLWRQNITVKLSKVKKKMQNLEGKLKTKIKFGFLSLDIKSTAFSVKVYAPNVKNRYSLEK